MQKNKVPRILLSILVIAMLLTSFAQPAAQARSVSESHTADPASVTIVGSLQSEISSGACGDWDPACAATHLTFDAADDVWQGSWTVPGAATAWEYKAALNNSWAENYGANANLNGANILLDLAVDTSVKFYYDHKSHWITDNKNSFIATAAGSFQSEIGCPGDWQPDCLRSWLQDPDGDGIYSFSTLAIPQGNYEFKVAMDEVLDAELWRWRRARRPECPVQCAGRGLPGDLLLG